MLQKQLFVDLITHERSCCHHVHASATMRCRHYYSLAPHRSTCGKFFPRPSTFFTHSQCQMEVKLIPVSPLNLRSYQEWNKWPSRKLVAVMLLVLLRQLSNILWHEAVRIAAYVYLLSNASIWT